MQVVIKKIIFKSDTGYLIAAATVLDHPKIKNISLKGNMVAKEGNLYECEGTLEEDRGTNVMHVRTWKPMLPAGQGRVTSYLRRNMGISEELARRLYTKFGDGVFDTLKNSPEQIATVEGIHINGDVYNQIVEKFSEAMESETISELRLKIPSITEEQAKTLFRFYGKNMIRKLEENVYETVCFLPGFSFKTAEAIAEKLGQKERLIDDYSRIRMAFELVMAQAEATGHLYLPVQALIYGHYCNRYLMPGVFDTLKREVPETRIKRVGNALVRDGILMAERDCIYTKRAFNDELSIANNIVRLLRGPNPYKQLSKEEQKEHLSFFYTVIEEFESRKGIRLEEMQKEAIITVFTNPLTIITGGPGTGKTTIQECILEINARMNGSQNVCLLAPTGQASRRMAEATGRMAATINSRCRISEDGFASGDDITDSLLIVDEFSMVGNHNAAILFEKIAAGTRTVIVGDVDQLPSVDAGNVLKELIASDCVPYVRLRFAFRSGVSVINSNAQYINIGNNEIDLSTDAFQFIELSSDEEVARTCVEAYKDAVTKHEYQTVAVLSPYRRKMLSGSNSLNLEIQSLLNPQKDSFLAAGIEFRVGDPVMQTKNKGERRNGDRGKVMEITAKQMTIRFDGEEDCEVIKKSGALTAPIDLAYATTIHKSQGSEYEYVIIPLLDAMEVMLKRNLLYTAVTRAKKKVLIVGSKKAMNLCISTIDNQRRNTLLGWRLQKAYFPQTAPVMPKTKAEKPKEQYVQQKLELC